MAAITIRNLDKAYGKIRVLHGINLDIADNSFVVFVGPSGCGKSTLLRTIAGLEEKERGEIESLAESKKIDMAIVLVSNLRSQALQSEVLIRSKRRLWLSANHPLLLEKRITLARIAGGLGYRIPVGDRLVFRIDGRYLHATDDGGNQVLVSLSIGGAFGR